MKALKIPEKLYFTIEELVDRWQCDESTVWHYINEGMIRPAIESAELALLDIMLSDDLDGIKINYNLQGADYWRRGSRNARLTDDCGEFLSWKDMPRYMYFDARNRIDTVESVVGWNVEVGIKTEQQEVWEVTVLETLEGKEYAVTEMQPPGNHSAECKPFRLDIKTHYLAPIITREERDRFESEHAMSDTPVTRSGTYSTHYIEVMHNAVAEFFEPRHDVDPKKAEVVDWVNTRLAEKGLRSDNIAQAIFTIIKPADHDPRKRRG